jgi:hypothetical protein
MQQHKKTVNDLETATADECLRDALRLQLNPGYAALRPDDETVERARARFAKLDYSRRLDMIAKASRIVCLALYADLNADLSSAQPRIVEV